MHSQPRKIHGLIIITALLTTMVGCRTSPLKSSGQQNIEDVGTSTEPVSTPEVSSELSQGKPSETSALSRPEPTAAEKTEAAKSRQLGLEYRGQGRYADAVEVLRNAVRLDPSNLSGQVILGWTLHLAGEAEQAIETLKQALSQDETHVPALNALGIVYLVAGDLKKAVDTHTQAVTLKPDNEIGYYNLSLAHHRLANYDRAIANAQTATRLEPGNPHPLVALALTQWASQNKDAAQQAYQQAIDLDPSYSEAWFLDHLQQAGFNLNQIQIIDTIRQSL